MKRYPVYKDSGVEWIGEIPDHWSIVPIKHSTKVNRATLPENTEPDFSFRYIDIGNVNHNGLTNPPKEMSFVEAPSRARRIVKNGDTIVSTVRTYLKAIHFITEDNNDLVVSTGFATLSSTNKLNPKFLYYAVSNQKLIDTICRFSVGVSYPAINSSELGSIPAWFPENIQEQQFITEYLDHKTHLIDTLIEKKQKQIELLQEQRAAIINQAVTKGLNPNVKMKDSGIEWLGEVPEHWDKIKLKHLSEKISDGEHISPKTLDEGIPLLSAKDVRKRHLSFNVEKFVTCSDSKKFRNRCNPGYGDILIVSRGATIGRIGYVETNIVFCLMGSVILVKPKTAVVSTYLFYALNSTPSQEQLLLASQSSAQQAIYLFHVCDLELVFPPIEEQKLISEYLESECSKIDNVIRKLTGTTGRLKEYRTTLISEVITGKIDVRSEVIP